MSKRNKKCIQRWYIKLEGHKNFPEANRVENETNLLKNNINADKLKKDWKEFLTEEYS